MKRLLLGIFALIALSASAQDDLMVRRGNCMPDVDADDVAAARSQAPRKLPSINRDWDPNKVYRQAVILITYSKTSDADAVPCVFSRENANETYNRIFNEAGYNERDGVGCVADYYRDQSNGLFNLVFDVYGPYQVDMKAQPYSQPTDNSRNYGKEVMLEATNKWIAENPTLDYKQYDWNGNGYINQVIYVSAGLSGNQSNQKCYGYIWPNTHSFSTITAPDGTKISNYTISCETWTNGSSCGIGTICHEYTHSLGLPDIYSTSSGEPVVDEWDLMDGGNFTNYGWCPTNWTPLEKMLLGWLTPTVLTEPTSVTNMKPVSEGGKVYQIKHTDNEYLLLENRQQKGWDLGAPGKGLVVYHVNYNASLWNTNSVNSTSGSYGFSLVSADNLDYNEWYSLLLSRKVSSQYQNKPRLNSLLMSTTPYPWSTDSTEVVNRELTDSSVPATLMFTENASSSKLLGKPITNITMTADGLVSFDFMGGNTVGIRNLTPSLSEGDGAVYDLQGRRLSESATSNQKPQIRIVRQADGTFRKVLK